MTRKEECTGGGVIDAFASNAKRKITVTANAHLAGGNLRVGPQDYLWLDMRAPVPK